MVDQPHAPGVFSTATPVTAEMLASLRDRISGTAKQAGFGDTQAHLFTTAVNEIVINAIEHGAPPIHVVLSVQGGTVTVEVRDAGPGLSRAPVPGDLPPPDQTHGRGLWIARRLCDELTFHTSDTGATVRLRSAARP